MGDFVALDPKTGQYYSSVGGNVAYYPSQTAAEQGFNTLTGQPNLASPTVVNTNPLDPWNALMKQQQASNQMNLDWSKEQYGKSLAEQIREFDLQQQMAGRNLYSQLAQSLLSGATSLRGPYDWLRYAQYTNGGQNIFNSLFGSAAAPQFGATGYSEPATIDKVLADLGLASPTGSTAQGGPMQTALAQATAPLTGTTQPAGTTSQQAGVPSQYVTQSTPANPSSGEVSAPLPYQINPGVWDSLSPTAQQMVLAAAEAGKTPSGAWDAGDYLRQLNNSRPGGVAPRQISYNWNQNGSYF